MIKLKQEEIIQWEKQDLRTETLQKVKRAKKSWTTIYVSTYAVNLFEDQRCW